MCSTSALAAKVHTTLTSNAYTLPILLAVLAVLLTTTLTTMGLFRPRLDLAGKFCYVPGGSAGLGAALSADLVKRGAHVVIVARDAARSAATVASLKALVPAGDDRQIFALSADLTSQAASANALDEACKAFGGRAPDYVFLCAGFSKPQLFVEATAEDMQNGLDGVYWVSAWTAHAATRLMVRQRQRGTLVIVSSFIGYTPVAGYATYAPGKFALRGLADALRAEMLLHGITVHLYMPAGILSPGYETEMRTKHAVTKKIEESDSPISPEAASRLLVAGLEKGNYQITNDFMTDMVRKACAGPVPWNGPMDVVWGALSMVVMPIFRRVVDAQTRGFTKQVESELEAKGFYDK